ncbi:hypothetical protein [Paenibacillus sp. MBLB4367]|uniref:hypothetical protein n=1 Tax=Paenibacillus sp. MBLB4367 TaxID=3384767 RepID=UPI00390815FD
MLDWAELAWVSMAAHAMLGAFGFIAFYYALQTIPYRKRRLRIAKWTGPDKRLIPPARLLRLLLVSPGPEAGEEKQQLLDGIGLPLHVWLYEAIRRIGIAAAGSAAAAAYMGFRKPSFTMYLPPAYVLAGAITFGLLLLFDKLTLRALKKQRSDRIVKEIYVLSHQLLYYGGSKWNLHSKLARCLPHARTIRSEFHLLLNEWYHDAEEAIQAFKRRVGTDEAYSFGDTLNAIRQNESDAYYQLLKQRIQDYKDKLDLLKASRKEAASYVLFVLAGIPILNTFRLFIYPWVQEGQQLFQTLN